MGFILMPKEDKTIAVNADDICTIEGEGKLVHFNLQKDSITVWFPSKPLIESVAVAVERAKHLTSPTSWESFVAQVLSSPIY